MSASRQEKLAALQEELDVVRRCKARPGEELYIIDADWLQRWRVHAENAAKSLGGVGPGPINNWQLLTATTGHSAPAPGLVSDYHYKAVPQPVWSLLQSRYGGGPQITNVVADIYTANVCQRQMSGRSAPSSGLSSMSRQGSNMTRTGSSMTHQGSGMTSTGSFKNGRLEAEFKFFEAHRAPAFDEPGCLIHAAWLDQWMNHVKGGGPLPGPITNHVLVDHEGEVRMGTGRHHHCISEAAWNFLEDRYGGGPRIESTDADFYPDTASVSTPRTPHTPHSPWSSNPSPLRQRWTPPPLASEKSGGQASITTSTSSGSMFSRMAAFMRSPRSSSVKSNRSSVYSFESPTNSVTASVSTCSSKDGVTSDSRAKAAAMLGKKGAAARQRSTDRAKVRKAGSDVGGLEGVAEVSHAGRMRIPH